VNRLSGWVPPARARNCWLVMFVMVAPWLATMRNAGIARRRFHRTRFRCHTESSWHKRQRRELSRRASCERPSRSICASSCGVHRRAGRQEADVVLLSDVTHTFNGSGPLGADRFVLPVMPGNAPLKIWYWAPENEAHTIGAIRRSVSEFLMAVDAAERKRRGARDIDGDVRHGHGAGAATAAIARMFLSFILYWLYRVLVYRLWLGDGGP